MVISGVVISAVDVVVISGVVVSGKKLVSQIVCNS